MADSPLLSQELYTEERFLKLSDNDIIDDLKLQLEQEAQHDSYY